MESVQLQELEQRGWTVVRGLVPRDLTSQARELVDAIIGGGSGVESVPTDRGQPGPWPADGGALPVITSSAFKHSINPPIDDAAFGHEGLLAKLNSSSAARMLGQNDTGVVTALLRTRGTWTRGFCPGITRRGRARCSTTRSWH